MTKRAVIRKLILQQLPRDQIISQLQIMFPSEDLEDLKNYLGVELFLCRKKGLIQPLVKSRKWSRHKIIKDGLYKNQTNSQILRRLKRHYPQIDEKIHKQRICEYRWFFNQGLL